MTVSRVIDGDTFEARLSDGSDQYVRLLGVDAPESFRRNEPNEYEDITNTVCLDEWGHRATVFVRDRLEGRGVILILASNGAERSLFGDLLAFVLVDGQDFNAMLVTLGYARVFTDEYSGRQEEYLVLQQQSEQSNLGLWACRDASSTPSATETPTRLPGPQATATPTAQPTVSPSPTVVLPPTATLIPTPTRTATTTPTVAPAPTTASELLATATPEPSATSMPLPTSTPIPTPSVGSIVIECIFFDGVVPRSESDEYVQIANLGSGTVDLVGWRLADVDDGTPEFTFPSYVLSPGARVRVYTNEIHPESGGFSFGRGSSIWNNGSPDTAGLFNSQGVQVSTKSYPPGCE